MTVNSVNVGADAAVGSRSRASRHVSPKQTGRIYAGVTVDDLLENILKVRIILFFDGVKGYSSLKKSNVSEAVEVRLCRSLFQVGFIIGGFESCKLMYFHREMLRESAKAVKPNEMTGVLLSDNILQELGVTG